MAVAKDFGFEPFAEGVDAFGADAVEAAGVFVGALAEFAAGVEVGEDEFDGGHLELGVHGHGDAAAVVADGAGAVEVEDDVDGFAKAGEVLVDGIVEHFEDAMVETALVGVADIHAGALADGFEAFEFVDLFGAVFLADGGHHVFVLFGKGGVLVWHGRKAGRLAWGRARRGNLYKADKRGKRNPLAGDSASGASGAVGREIRC